MVGLEKRLCSLTDDIHKVIEILETEIDFKSVSKKIDALRIESTDFLKNSLLE
jgi:hypothetical protein